MAAGNAVARSAGIYRRSIGTLSCLFLPFLLNRGGWLIGEVLALRDSVGG
jgi:hypothetical protein